MKEHLGEEYILKSLIFAIIKDYFGELAQLVECCDRTAEVRGSIPLFSIKRSNLGRKKNVSSQ